MDNVETFLGLGSLSSQYDFSDKDKNIHSYINYMLNRTSQIFRYENLPETMPKRYIELYLQINGHLCVIKDNDNLYALFGSFGGYPDAYYMPTKYVISNPYLNISKVFDIGYDCIVVPNDTMYCGLLPLFKRYATSLVENDLTMRIADINARMVSIISAQDDATKDSANLYLKNIINGEMGVIANTAFLDGLKVNEYATGSNAHCISQLIELQQYLKASWYNEIGLNANYNMKREAINSNESQLNDDMLYPLIDDMYEQRKTYFDKVNEMFGTDIKVSFNSSWEDNKIELYMEQKAIDSDLSETTEDVIEETPEDVTEETTEDVTEETTEDVTEETTEDVTEENIENALDDIVEALDNIASVIEGDENNDDSNDE